MTQHATGSFEVELTPHPAGTESEQSVVGRMSILKRFVGQLDATSSGQMLSVGTSVKGSAAYVAIEFVSGALDGRTGTFVLQHSGIMTRGTPRLTISVVPDSGTGELAGLAGTMTLKITGRDHFYDLEYSIDEREQV